MKTYIADIFPKIQKFSKKLDNLSLLVGQSWILVNDDATKVNYIFRANGDLLLSNNGKVEKAKWEHLGNNSILIDRSERSFLFKHGFIDEYILALRLENSEEYAVFINENKIESNFDNIEKVNLFLENRYLEKKDTPKAITNTRTLDKIIMLAWVITVASIICFLIGIWLFRN